MPLTVGVISSSLLVRPMVPPGRLDGLRGVLIAYSFLVGATVGVKEGRPSIA